MVNAQQSFNAIYGLLKAIQNQDWPMKTGAASNSDYNPLNEVNFG
jgi:hypothetical protein